MREYPGDLQPDALLVLGAIVRRLIINMGNNNIANTRSECHRLILVSPLLR